MTSITYLDTDNVSQTWAASNYFADTKSSPIRIGLNSTAGASLPTIANRLSAIEITYSVGESMSENIPIALKQAMLILVGQFYENRQVAVVGRSVGKIPMTAEYLMNPYRIQTLGMD